MVQLGGFLRYLICERETHPVNSMLALGGFFCGLKGFLVAMNVGGAWDRGGLKSEGSG
jgi:hypothetical protein